MIVKGSVIHARYAELFDAARSLSAPADLLNSIIGSPVYPAVGFTHLQFDTLPWEAVMREPGQSSFRDRMIAQIVAQTLEPK